MGFLETFSLALFALFTAVRARNQLKCESGKTCISSYQTGNAICAAGYDKYPHTARGHPGGSYCERACTEAEASDCAAEKCAFYSPECTRTDYPATGVCTRALDYCKGPVEMAATECTRIKTGRPVDYDEATGRCSVGSPRDDDEHVLRFDYGESFVSLHLHTQCAPLTAAGAAAVDALLKHDRCLRLDCDGLKQEGLYEWVERCKVGKDKFARIEVLNRAVGEAAEHPGTEKPEFVANRD